jgi:dienelactone hydrolase
MDDPTRRDVVFGAAGAMAARTLAGEALLTERLPFDYAVDGVPFEGQLSVPRQRQAPMPAVLLCHEWSGLNDGMRQVADRVAGLGYACFALDLYGKGVRGVETGDNSHLMGPLMADRALLKSRLLGGLQAASSRIEADASRMAAIGYCFGGLCALDLARASPPSLRAAVSIHGTLQPTGLATGPIRARVLLLHGWRDPVAGTTDDLVAIGRELDRAGSDWQLHVYGRAMHAFTAEGLNSPERGLAYDPYASASSWEQMRSFLQETLQ